MYGVYTLYCTRLNVFIPKTNTAKSHKKTLGIHLDKHTFSRVCIKKVQQMKGQGSLKLVRVFVLELFIIFAKSNPGYMH